MKKRFLELIRSVVGTNQVLKKLDAIIKYNYENRRFQLTEHLLHDTELGISTEKYTDHDIIVSLTTYGKRIHEVAFTIESIMQQTIKANKIVLWLDNSFEKEKLPQSLLLLQERGLEIQFCKDIRSYTKLVPALRRYPDAAIITIDDDALYEPDLLETLIFPYIEDPQYIYCHRFHKIKFDKKGKLLPYNEWEWMCNEETASHLNFATGVGGVLYPPYSLDEEVKNEAVFLDICRFADDIWFNAMAIKKGTLVKKVYSRSKKSEDYILNDCVQDIALGNLNVQGDHLNDVQLNAVFSKYNLFEKLK